VAERHFPHVDLRVPVEQDPAAAQEEQVQPLDLRDDFVTGKIADRHGVVHAL
jgi:hypothetical protein